MSVPRWPRAECSGLLLCLVCFLCVLAAETCTADGACDSLPETPLQYSPFLYLLRVSRECVISPVLSCHSKNLKQQMLNLTARHSSPKVLQLHVIAHFYLENTSWRCEGMPTQKTQREERERERERESECTHMGETPPALWFLFYIFFPSPWACPMQIGLARSAVCST